MKRKDIERIEIVLGNPDFESQFRAANADLHGGVLKEALEMIAARRGESRIPLDSYKAINDRDLQKRWVRLAAQDALTKDFNGLIKWLPTAGALSFEAADEALMYLPLKIKEIRAADISDEELVAGLGIIVRLYDKVEDRGMFANDAVGVMCKFGVEQSIIDQWVKDIGMQYEEEPDSRQR